MAILRVLEKCSTYGGDWGDQDNITFDLAAETLKTFYGTESLRAYDDSGNLVSSNFEGVIRSGWPAHVFDCLEAWFDHAEEAERRNCEQDLNQVFAINNSRWRFVNGTTLLVDSQYLREEVVTPALILMHDQGAHGALDEFTTACNYLAEGRTKDAVVAAHKSVESVMKTVLGEKEGRFGGLIAALIKSGVVPKYYEEFLVHLEKILLAAGKERNLPGRGHGQGQDPVEVARPLAEFAVNLAATVNLFLLKHWADKKGDTEQDRTPLSGDESLPFDPSPFKDDDLPF